MLTHATAPPAPGFIDRIRDLIAKVFGSPGRAAQGAEPVAAGGVPTTAPPADKRVGLDRRDCAGAL